MWPIQAKVFLLVKFFSNPERECEMEWSGGPKKFCVQDQCDQMFEFNVAQFSLKVAQNLSTLFN